MQLFIALSLISLAIYLFFVLSAKQRIKTQQSHFAVLMQCPKTMRALAILLLGLSLYPLRAYYGSSIGFIALFLYCTPILLLLILINRS